MKVKELIKELKKVDKEADVFFREPYDKNPEDFLISYVAVVHKRNMVVLES